jgi:hypothetical protein
MMKNIFPPQSQFATSPAGVSAYKPEISKPTQRKIDDPRSLDNGNQRWFHDRWLLITVIISCCASIIAVWYFFQNNQILLLGDTYAHMLIARRLFDNSTPGLAHFPG